MLTEKEKRALRDKALTLFETAEAEKRDLTIPERGELNDAMNKLEEGNFYDEVNKIASQPAYSSRGRDYGADSFNSMMDFSGKGISQATNANPREYRSLFPDAPHKDTGGFKSFRDFVRVLTSGRFDPRLEERVMLESVPGLGGFAVPTQFISEILDGGLENEVMRPRAAVYPMTSNTLQVPAWDGANHTSTLYGAMTGAWLAENAAATPVTPTLRRIELNAKKLAVYVDISREMMADAPGFQGSLESAMIKAVGWYLDDAFLTGDGLGKPLGVIAAPSTITESKEVGQAIDTFTFDNCISMWSRLLPVCQTRAIWAANPSVIPQLYRMSLAVGTGGVAVYQPAGGASMSPFTTLMGRPVIFTEKLPVLGDLGDIVLMDPSMYKIGMRQEIIMDMSNAVGWLNDYISLRVIARVDGQPEMDTAVTPAHGTSQSWAVMLEAR